MKYTHYNRIVVDGTGEVEILPFAEIDGPHFTRAQALDIVNRWNSMNAGSNYHYIYWID